jgi:primosomal replication protein N
MPLKFSRRHGDPSRPWNQFSINTHDENDGSKILDYQGNWRDIFQNWEALAHSYPEFIEGMIFRFLNASTFDGYNPYRITKNGIDWERIEADDPWSYIGYWGDHQIIYLLKFLEFSENHYPGKLESYFNEDLFVYANVPYKIKKYADLLANPKDTIDFDHEADHAIAKKWPSLGADSALLTYQNGSIVQVNFIEKILASLLAKISNFIPEGGIWMNTQRPEWNDANNALVGNGVSMVTLSYMIRFLKFTHQLFGAVNTKSVSVSKELKTFYAAVMAVLEQHQHLLSGKLSDQQRKLILDGLGMAGSNFRESVYANSFEGEKQDLSMSNLLHFSELCLQYLTHTLKANKRADGLYHAYNLMSVEGDDAVSIAYLSEMLEGQVAVLSSGNLSSQEALEVLDALKASKLFRADQYSYMLYPNKELPGFINKNNIPSAAVNASKLLQALVNDGNTQILAKDVNGVHHFNGNFKNASDLAQALEQLKHGKYAALVASEQKQVLQAFEDVFNHKAFTGRSGTFFGYEGLGSIYWHMVSKLLVATQECCLKAIEDQEDAVIVGRLLEHYYEINAGIGNHKSPMLYGAFPTDPYSHTPQGKGAQQPGMTGQVKEDILCRFGELGVMVNHGCMSFKPQMLRREEFLTSPSTFDYVNIASQNKQLHIEAGSLCFTYCQVPVVYSLSARNHLQITMQDGSTRAFEGLSLDADTSHKVFQRSGAVTQITVFVDTAMLK